MKVIIAGSRSITDPREVEAAIRESGFEIAEVVCGGARGVDMLGCEWAQERGIPVAWYPAEWDRYGKSAGYRRNEKMALYADALIAVWDGESRGTKHMLDIAHREGLQVFSRRVSI
jgi:hypothetical protein